MQLHENYHKNSMVIILKYFHYLLCSVQNLLCLNQDLMVSFYNLLFKKVEYEVLDYFHFNSY